jgi:hypothetical protein
MEVLNAAMLLPLVSGGSTGRRLRALRAEIGAAMQRSQALESHSQATGALRAFLGDCRRGGDSPQPVALAQTASAGAGAPGQIQDASRLKRQEGRRLG